MKQKYRITRKHYTLSLLFFGVLIVLFGCANDKSDASTLKKKIVRISHSQAVTHPQHLALLEFEKIIEEELGDKFDVEVYPNEILGSSTNAIELVQTGAIDFVVSSTANLETFDDIYEVFSMPYLFDGEESYYKTMNDEGLIDSIFNATDDAGFRGVTWYTAGTRNFYTNTRIETPEDLKGMRLRVIQSPTNVKMMQAFGAAATPMSFGEVYTAIQQGVIDGAENNELALTKNKHGEVAPYYIYNMHQIIPDVLIGNVRFLDSLTDEEQQIFANALEESNRVELELWDEAVEEAVKEAKEMGVEFIETDTKIWKEQVVGLQQEILDENERLVPIYDRIQEINKEVEGE